MTLIPVLEKLVKNHPDKEGPTITVDGLSGSGKSTVGKTISSTFNLPLYNVGDIFRSAAKEMNIPLEKTAGEVPPELHKKADAKTLELAMKGNCVIIGRISGWAAGDHSDYKVFLNPPLSKRATWVSKREGTPYKETLENLRKRDNDNNSTYEKVYKMEFNTSIYNLVLDNSKMPIREANNFVLEKVKKALENWWRRK